MKRLFTALSVVLFSSTCCCALTTAELYKACTSEDNTPQGIMCAGYLRGLLTGLRAGQALQKGHQPLCFPSKGSLDADRVILKKFIENAPKSLSNENEASGDASALLAFIDAYLCPKPN